MVRAACIYLDKTQFRGFAQNKMNIVCHPFSFSLDFRTFYIEVFLKSQKLKKRKFLWKIFQKKKLLLPRPKSHTPPALLPSDSQTVSRNKTASAKNERKSTNPKPSTSKSKR